VPERRLGAAFALWCALAPCVTHAAESTRVVGIVFSSQPSRSVAIVTGREGRQKAVHEGSDFDGAEVVAIHQDDLVLRRNGQLVTLRLDDVANGSAPPANGAVALPASPDVVAMDDDGGAQSRAAHAAHRATPPRQTSASQRASRPRERARDKDSEESRSNDEMLADLASMARFVPVLDDNGKLRGVAVINLVPDSLLEQMGLRSDDVITSVNGVRVDASDNALNAIRKLTPGQPATVGVERRGAPATIQVPSLWVSRARRIVRR
jgi:type II secretion system protein C